MTNHLTITDTHTHVFIQEIQSLIDNRNYTPGAATSGQLMEHLERINAKNVVLVQPSVYGNNNTAILKVTNELGLSRARTVVVVNPEVVTCEELSDLEKRGARGVRINMKTSGVNLKDEASAQLAQAKQALAGTDLLLEVFAPLPLLTSLKNQLRSLGRPIILDHFAGLKTNSPTMDQDLEGLLDLLRSPNTILKLSGACRATNYASDTSALDPIAPALINAAKDRVIWGSDWPHTGKSSERSKRPLSEIEPFLPIDDVQSLEAIKRWCGDTETLEAVTSRTANALFGF